MPRGRRPGGRHPHPPVGERIAAIDDFVAAGYEVHLNFSPVVLREGWVADWAALLEQLDDALGTPPRRSSPRR